MSRRVERRGGGVCGKGVKEPFAPTLPAVYIENFKYPEYPASGLENPDRLETPGVRPETTAPPQSEQTKAQKNLI